MATVTTKPIGKMPCYCCGETLTLRQNAAGTVSASCQDCDFTAYAKAGTDAQRRILARATLRSASQDSTPQASAPAPAPKATPKASTPPPPPPAAPVRRNTIFG